MINIRTTVIGEREVVEVLRDAPERIQTLLVARLAEIGQGITDDARARVPVRTGALRDAIRFKIDTPKDHLRLVVQPSGWGADHAHLIERGVERQQIDVHKRNRAQRLRVSKKTGRLVKGREYWAQGAFMYRRWHHVTAHPYFIPAVEDAGDVGARLQDAVSAAARGTP